MFFSEKQKILLMEESKVPVHYWKIFLITKIYISREGENRLSKYSLAIYWHIKLLCFLCYRSEGEGEERKGEKWKRVKEKREET